MKHPWSVLVVSMGLFAGAVPAQIIPGPVGADTFSLSGTVSEVTSVLPVWIPLKGARLIAIDQNPLIMGPVPVYQLLDTAYTDSAGAYAFKQLVVSYGILTLQVSCQGYHDSTLTLVVKVYYDSILDYGAASQAYVLNPQLRKIAARERCVVIGQVLEKTSGSGGVITPVPNVLVSVRPDVVIPLDWWWSGLESYEAVSDARGYFTIIAAVTSDTDFILNASHPDYQTASQRLVLHAADTSTGNVIYLSPLTTPVRGTAPVQVISTPAAAWPQPAQGQINITVPAGFRGQSVTAALFDLQGRLVWSRDVAAASLAIPAQAPGTYWLEITAPAGCVYRQAINCIK